MAFLVHVHKRPLIFKWTLCLPLSPAFRKMTLANAYVSLRLPQHLLDSIKTAANARDVPYQSLIKVWLQEKLQGS
jgi:predicted DNA binding CopG/RHH family protein